MNLNYWEKVTKYTLFGVTLLKKIECCKDYDIANMTYTIKVSPEYYDAEFKDKDA